VEIPLEFSRRLHKTRQNEQTIEFFSEYLLVVPDAEKSGSEPPLITV
jgi:hypothetical protein